MIRIHRIPPPECTDCRGHGAHYSGTDPIGEGRPCSNHNCVDGIDAACGHCHQMCGDIDSDWWLVSCGGDDTPCASRFCVDELKGELEQWLAELEVA